MKECIKSSMLLTPHYLFSLFIGDKTGQRVKVIVADFIKENVFIKIEDQLKDLNIGVLGWTFFYSSM